MDRDERWVEIEMLILPFDQRVAKLPEDTSQVDLTARIKGFLAGEAHVGDQVRIRTILGREVEGKLLSINPPYQATFGAPVAELITIGTELKNIMRETCTASRIEEGSL